MSAIVASILRIIGISAAGYAIGDVINWFQLKAQKGVQPAPFGKTMLAIFTSRGFVIFILFISAAFYLIFKNRIKKLRK